MNAHNGTYDRSRFDDGLQLSYNARDSTLTVRSTSGGNPDRVEERLRFPIRVVAEITSRCNMRCTYCSQGGNPRGDSIPTDAIFRIIDDADRYRAFKLSLRGAEALLHPDFKQIWDHAVSKEFISTDLVTNGILLTEQRALSMLENGRSRIVVSLDGPDAINSESRNPHQYTKVMKWLLPVLRQKPDQITVVTTAFRHNYGHIPEFAAYLCGLGLRHYNISLLKRLGRATQDLGFLSSGEIYRLEESLAAIAIASPLFAPVISTPFFTEDRDMYANVPIQLFSDYFCGSGMKIMVDGRIGISQMIHFDSLSESEHADRYHKDRNCLGRISDRKSLQQIWLENDALRRAQARRAKKNFRYMIGLESQLGSE
ncbi:radical SAM protein [Accumulibacter sp.]|uniref:radical SAM protein n=1 Tax=Accumulibacter sp. TaxID=2053492 RepID=UPI00263528F6|nr:radical SAM protein [Accumulibacter sp.]